MAENRLKIVIIHKIKMFYLKILYEIIKLKKNLKRDLDVLLILKNNVFEIFFIDTNSNFIIILSK